MIDQASRIIMIGVAMILPGWAMAHDGAGPHGGRLVDLPKHHLELVVKNEVVDVFVSDQASRPISAAGLTGLAIVVTASGSTRIPLAATDANRLSGKADAKLPGGAKSVVQVRLADGQTIQASFD